MRSLEEKVLYLFIVFLGGIWAFSCSKEPSPTPSHLPLKTQTRVIKKEVKEKSFLFYRTNSCPFYVKGINYSNYWLLPDDQILQPEFKTLIHREYPDGMSELNGSPAFHDTCGFTDEEFAKLLRKLKSRVIVINHCDKNSLLTKPAVINELKNFKEIGLTSIPANDQMVETLSTLPGKLHLSFSCSYSIKDIHGKLADIKNIVSLHSCNGIDEDHKFKTGFPRLRDFHIFGSGGFSALIPMLSRSPELEIVSLASYMPSGTISIGKDDLLFLRKLKKLKFFRTDDISFYYDTPKVKKNGISQRKSFWKFPEFPKNLSITDNDKTWFAENRHKLKNVEYLHLKLKDLSGVIGLLPHLNSLRKLDIETLNCSGEDIKILSSLNLTHLQLTCSFPKNNQNFKGFTSLTILIIYSLKSGSTLDLSGLKTLRTLVIGGKHDDNTFILPENISTLDIKTGKNHKSLSNLRSLKNLIVRLENTESFRSILSNQSIETIEFVPPYEIKENISFPTFSPLNNLQYVRFHDWRGTLPETLTANIMTSLKKCPSLKTVNFYNVIDDNHFNKLQSLNNRSCQELAESERKRWAF